ncbi:MAG: glycoside hydrolase family 2 protein [Bacteroidota bacterium]
MSMLSNAQPIEQSLNSNSVYWEFHEFNSHQMLPAFVPGNVHQDLIKAGKIPDPLIGTNEQEVQWVETRKWEYQCANFSINEDLLKQEQIWIKLEGIDTHAEVFLNNSSIGTCNNAFVCYEFDIKKVAKKDNNLLQIRFYPPVPIAQEILKNRILPLPGDSIRAVIRKPQYHFGWDWGPRLVTCGITKNISIVGYTNFKVDHAQIETIQANSDSSLLRFHLFYNSKNSQPCEVQIYYNNKAICSSNLNLKAGIEHTFLDVQIPFSIPLWWPNGSGDQHLATFKIEIKSGNQTWSKSIRTGIRKVKLVTEKDKEGETFFFEVNGKRIFMKGANYIPLVMLPTVPDTAKYRSLLNKCKESHFNMLRVWGGGQYEHDIFYELCDEMGILIWQDFMFACSMYPGNSDFLNNVKLEAQQNIARIAYHPCIALWCGNNENAEGWERWGWKIGLREKSIAGVQSEYDELFERLLPETLKKYSCTSYWPSSPRFGRGDAASQNEGDSHYWGLWHDEEPFSVLERKVPRFMSEFGMQSFPCADVLQLMSPTKPSSIDAPGFLQHQKHSRGFALMKVYTEKWYPNASSKEITAYGELTQRMQAEGMTRAIEVQRASERCGGTLYWQLNDVWPAFSWSSIDYLGNEKLFFKALKVSYAPQLLTYKLNRQSIDIIWVDDQFNGKYTLQLSGKIEVEKSKEKNRKKIFEIRSQEIVIESPIQVIQKIPLNKLELDRKTTDLILSLQGKTNTNFEKEFIIRKD